MTFSTVGIHSLTLKEILTKCVYFFTEADKGHSKT